MMSEWTDERLAELSSLLRGRMRPVFERAGAVIERKLREHGYDGVSDLHRDELAPWLQSALIEAAVDLHPHIDIEILEKEIRPTFVQIAMTLSANSKGSQSLN